MHALPPAPAPSACALPPHSLGPLHVVDDRRGRRSWPFQDGPVAPGSAPLAPRRFFTVTAAIPPPPRPPRAQPHSFSFLRARVFVGAAFWCAYLRCFVKVNGVMARVLDTRFVCKGAGRGRVLRERSWREGPWRALAGRDGAPACLDLGGVGDQVSFWSVSCCLRRARELTSGGDVSAAAVSYSAPVRRRRHPGRKGRRRNNLHWMTVNRARLVQRAVCLA